MARLLKPYKVDEVRTAEARVDVMLNRNNGTFFAELNENRVEAPSLAECKKLALEMIPGATSLTWSAKICVRSEEGGSVWRGNSRSESATVDLCFLRYEIAVRNDESVIRRDHPLDNDDPRRESHRHYVNEGDAELDYEQDVWDALLVLRQNIEDAAARLRDLVGSPNLRRLLVRGALRIESRLLRPARRGAKL